MIRSPQSFVIATECRKAAFQNGYRRDLGQADGWARFGSTTARGSIALASASDTGPWYLALDHAGVIAELEAATASLPGPGLARYEFTTLTRLYTALPRVYALAVSLPDGPLEAFRDAVKDMPGGTEVERMAIQRVGQTIFRDRLLTYWCNRCPLTGIADRALLRASHIKPWAACDTDAERLDTHNGLLLSALWDAAFDQGLVTFADDGAPVFALTLSDAARRQLTLAPAEKLRLTDMHRVRLAWHRTHVFDRTCQGG